MLLSSVGRVFLNYTGLHPYSISSYDVAVIAVAHTKQAMCIAHLLKMYSVVFDFTLWVLDTYWWEVVE